MNKSILYITIVASFILSCGRKPVQQQQTGPKRLPYLGEPMITSHEENGKLVADTAFPVIPSFSFINQEGKEITGKNFDGCIYVADFFFTSCPTICPIMKKELLRVYEA